MVTRKQVIPVLGLLAILALPSTAFGQATRTWVSGVGDDANPCSRTAPCKTFAGAISKTANGGEINVLDPGGFGGVTITKSIHIRGVGNTAGVLVSGTNAIVINAAATDRVTLSGLDINGVGTGAQTSLTGIKILSAGRVYITNNEIYRFRAAIANVPTSANTRVFVTNNQIHHNGIGLIAAPGSAAGDNVFVSARRNEFFDNTCGVVVSGGGTNASTPDAAVNCGTGSALAESATVRLFENSITDNTTGVFTRGIAVAEIGRNDITDNPNAGLFRTGTSVIRTYGNNHISGNGPNHMTPNESVTTG